MKKISLLLLLGCFALFCQAQGTAFGLKGGLTLGTQNGASQSNGILFSWHGAVSAESISASNSAFGLIAQLGYHNRGYALRNQRFNGSNGGVFDANAEYEFNNISLMLGAKQKFELRENTQFYYLFGIRGEYTVNNNIECQLIPLLDGFVQRWNYGFTVGGGIEFMFSELVGGFLEFAVMPDVSFQYRQPLSQTVLFDDCNFFVNPNANGTIVPAREFRNLSFEISLGIRLLRVVEYID